MRLTPQGISSFRSESKIVRLREFLPSERWKDLEVGTSLPVKTYSVAIMILPITLLTRSSFSRPGIYLGMSSDGRSRLAARHNSWPSRTSLLR